MVLCRCLTTPAFSVIRRLMRAASLHESFQRLLSVSSMKGKLGKIIAVFSVQWDILGAFFCKLQGFEDPQKASLIAHTWLLGISVSVTSVTIT